MGGRAGSGIWAPGPAPCGLLPAAHAPRARAGGRAGGAWGRGRLGCTGGRAVSPSLRPQTAFADERSTSQGSQPPPAGSPLSREEGEAPPAAPAEEGRRRSRRVRLRGSCRHRPSLLGRRELASSGPAGPATASSEVSRVGTKGAGLAGPGTRLLRPGPPDETRAPVDRWRWAKERECRSTARGARA